MFLKHQGNTFITRTFCVLTLIINTHLWRFGCVNMCPLPSSYSHDVKFKKKMCQFTGRVEYRRIATVLLSSVG